MKIFYFSNKLSIFSKYFEVSDIIEPRTAMNSLIYWTDIHKAHQRRGIRVSETFAESWSSGAARPDQRERSIFPWKGMSRSDRGWEVEDSLRPYEKREPFAGSLFDVRAKGIEPIRLSAPDPKSGLSTNFNTPAELPVPMERTAKIQFIF